MWNLSEARGYLGERLSETSTAFWPNDERNQAINEAQKLVASVTRGVPSTVSGDVGVATPYLSAPAKLLSDYPIAGWVGGSELTALQTISLADANAIDPGWPQRRGTPRWVLPHLGEGRIYFAPVPTTAVSVSATVSVLPDDLTADTDELFNGEGSMERYQDVVLTIAASLLLLKERYDGDAERFFQFAMQELQALGVDPARIPKFGEVAQAA